MKEEEEEEVAGDGALLVGRSLTHCTLTHKKKCFQKRKQHGLWRNSKEKKNPANELKEKVFFLFLCFSKQKGNEKEERFKQETRQCCKFVISTMPSTLVDRKNLDLKDQRCVRHDSVDGFKKNEF